MRIRASPPEPGARWIVIVAICAISMWEVAQLAAKGRLELQDDAETWLTRAVGRPNLQVFDLTPAICAVGADFG